MTKTVLIAVHNPEDHIISYVEELLSACVPHVIVVDDGSDMLYQPAFETLDRLPGCTVIHHSRVADANEAMKEGIRYYETYLKPLAENEILAVNYDSAWDREHMLDYIWGRDQHARRITLDHVVPDNLGQAIMTPVTELVTMVKVFITGGIRALSRY